MDEPWKRDANERIQMKRPHVINSIYVKCIKQENPQKQNVEQQLSMDRIDS